MRLVVEAGIVAEPVGAKRTPAQASMQIAGSSSECRHFRSIECLVEGTVRPLDCCRCQLATQTT